MRGATPRSGASPSLALPTEVGRWPAARWCGGLRGRGCRLYAKEPRSKKINPDSSPKLPADLYADADRTAQAEFEEAVADSSYFADPDFEWEPGLEGS